MRRGPHDVDIASVRHPPASKPIPRVVINWLILAGVIALDGCVVEGGILFFKSLNQ
jgi:hypothetical protein